MEAFQIKEIKPFKPRSFPPNHLNMKELQTFLDKAKQDLEDLSINLKKLGFPFSYFKGLLIAESLASLSSQNIKGASFDRILIARNEHKRANDISPILDYIEALKWLSKTTPSSQISKSVICKLHMIIKRSSSVLKDKKDYRDKQNWIGAKGCSIDQAYFYPPTPKDAKKMMSQLLRFYHSKHKKPLLQLALLFAQFLIIHPFMDGNGRVARVFIPLFLFKKNIIFLPLLFMSRYFKRHRLRYFQNLFHITETDRWEEWVIFFLKGVSVESKRTSKILKKMQRLIALELPKGVEKLLYSVGVFSTNAFRKAGGSDSLLEKLKLLKILKNNRKDLWSIVIFK